ncbi:class I SAM-dependent methyltransferase [Bacillus tianshenii]|nr:class I SAM-dependent methyltransferase [Bacillus tianshenii]
MEDTNELLSGERIYPISFNEAAIDHKERYQLALNYISRDDNILDCATGAGYGAYYLAVNSNCNSVVGIDINEHAINWANENFKTQKNIYLKTDLLEDFSGSLPNNDYDLVTCFETIEHLKDDYGFLKRLSGCMKPGGILIISSPNEEVIPCLANPFYPGGKNPYHHRHYAPSELKNLLNDCGFSIIEAYTQCPDKIVKGENGFVIIYVCKYNNMDHKYSMNTLEQSIEKLSVIQMNRHYQFLNNSLSNSIDFTLINKRIDEILVSNYAFMEVYELIEGSKINLAYQALDQIDEKVCPEKNFLKGLIYQTSGDLYKAIESYTILLSEENRINPIIYSVAKEQFHKIIEMLPK